MTASNGAIWTNVTLFSYKAPNGPDNNEIAFPIYLDHAGSNTPVKIHCTAGFGGKTPCSIEGMTVYVDPRMTPQDGGCPPTSVCKADNHWALIDTADGREIDAWQAQWPPVNGVLTVAWGGYCDLAGNGFTATSYHGPSWNSGCQALAAHAPQSVGPIRPADLMAALADPVHGHLPAALSTVYVCPGPGPLPAPFTGSGDGKCAGNAPEGAHWAIDLHDADVDALHLAPLLAVIVRTADIDHYGAFIVDSASTTNSGGQMDLNVISSRAYTSFGLADPWPGVLAEAVKEGQTRFSDPDRYGVSFLIPSSVAAKIVFL